jgi:hypothetical protein
VHGCLIAAPQFLAALFQIEQANRMRRFLSVQDLADCRGQIHHHSCLLVDHGEKIRQLDGRAAPARPAHCWHHGDRFHVIHLLSSGMIASQESITCASACSAHIPP